MRKESLIHHLPTALLTLQSIVINFLNTEYNLKAILFSSLISVLLIIFFISKKKTLQLPKKVTLTYFLFISVSLLAFFFSKTPNEGLAEITQDLSSITLFFATINYFKNYSLNFLYKLSSFNIVIQFAAVLYQVISQSVPRGFGSFMSFYDHRLVYPNALALSILMSVLAIQDSKFKYKTHHTIIGLITLLLTFSRGALIALIVAGSLYLTIKAYNKNWKEIRSITISVLISTLSFLLINNFVIKTETSLTEKLTFQGTEQITSVMERKQFWTLSPQLTLNHPLVGWGPNSFSYIFPSVQEIPLSNSQHPHNIFLKIGVERGLIALMLFILICIFTLQIIFKKNLIIHSPGLITAITAAGLHSMIDYNFNLPLNAFLLTILLAAIWKFSDENTQKSFIPLSTTTITIFLTITLGFYHLTLKYPQHSPLDLNHINYKDSLIQASLITENIDQKIDLVSKHTDLNQYDSFAYSNLAHLYTLKNEKTKAIQLFQKSIDLNPLNFWYPYAELTSIYTRINSQETTKIIKTLEKYDNAAKQNLHFTAQSNNIDQAIKTTENLINISKDQQQKEKLSEILLNLQSSQERFSSN